ncbi:TIF3F1, partial [Symbiodinium microadriaticum]
EALLLSDEYLPTVKLHATAVFSILNSHIRREDRSSRVIGTLLGFKQDGCINVTDCFAVPHMERNDEVYVAINKDYHKSMYAMHKRINRKELIIGWYTTVPEGSLLTDNSSLIHEFYSHECSDPVHLVVDASLTESDINIRAFISKAMVVGENALANMFQEVHVELCLSPAETTCLNHMISGQEQDSTFSSPEMLSSIPSVPADLTSSLRRLVGLVDKISAYVDEVAAGTREPDAQIGIMIADVLSSLQVVGPDDFQRYMDAKTQDMLMVSYLSNLTKAQLAVAEKLIQVI